MIKTAQQMHVLSLVIKRERDIPTIRAKAKTMAEICGFRRVERVQVAVAASELARFTLRHLQGGRVSFHMACKRPAAEAPERAGLLLRYTGRSCPSQKSMESHLGRPPLKGLSVVMDETGWFRDQDGNPVIECVKWGCRQPCRKIEEQSSMIKKELFQDLEESYLENLRAKHQEVLDLLKTLSQKNLELDRVNAELLELSRDMESLVHERTVVELALRIADRVRNPATAIGGLARILLQKLPDDFKHRAKIEAIYKEARKLEAIVKDFEGLAREQEKFFVETDLKELVQETINAWQTSFKSKDLELKLSFPEEEIRVFANPRTIKVALLHILKNAYEASPPGSRIEVSISRMDGNPYISVKDYGTGIRKEVMDRLFKELVTTKSSGTGVGLIMVHHIMKEHQGDIKIESHEGLGTTVTLVFPSRWKEKG